MQQFFDGQELREALLSQSTPPPHTVGLLTYFGARFDTLGNVLGLGKGFRRKNTPELGPKLPVALPSAQHVIWEVNIPK
jgi:hypothetical protein